MSPFDKLRANAVALWVGAALTLAGLAAHADEPKKVLKVAFRVAESGFDPAKINDVYSIAVTGHIFEALFTYDHLARPAKIRPQLAAAMPTVSEDFRT